MNRTTTTSLFCPFELIVGRIKQAIMLLVLDGFYNFIIFSKLNNYLLI